MKVQFVAGFGPVVRDLDASRRFYKDALGLPLPDESYSFTEELEGVKHFGLWTLDDAAESCFGKGPWPPEVPVPQGGIEFDLESPEAVRSASEELEGKGYRLLVRARLEPWGQTVSRLLSPEGLLIGIVFTPWMHRP
jgi:catechol 2,3-dioxygenase-like lactoylglutathione lyase family enzyme